MFYRRFASSSLLFSLISAAALAQTPQPVFKAPPEIEQALRARVTEFFQLHVESNFRKAYGMVAEDTKDYYFGAQKNTFVSFRITGVKFLNDNFTRASVDLECEQRMLKPEFRNVVIPLPMTTLWKIEDGLWVWYRDPDNKNVTPMGPSDLDKIKPGDPLSPEALKELTSPDALARRAGKIFGQSNLDKQEVTLALDKPSSAEVTFHNGQPGYIKLVLDAGMKPAGFNATLDKVDVGANENAVLKLTYEPPAGGTLGSMPESVRVRLTVQPFNMVFPVVVKFAGPAPANR